MTENMQKSEVRGADISRPIDRIELGGKEYPLAFDHACMRVAEDVYELQYGRNVNFADILRYLAAGKLGAIMAILYGALLSGAAAHGEEAEPMTWREYADQFKLTSIQAVRELLMRRVKESLPEAEEEEENPQ